MTKTVTDYLILSTQLSNHFEDDASYLCYVMDYVVNVTHACFDVIPHSNLIHTWPYITVYLSHRINNRLWCFIYIHVLFSADESSDIHETVWRCFNLLCKMRAFVKYIKQLIEIKILTPWCVGIECVQFPLVFQCSIDNSMQINNAAIWQKVRLGVIGKFEQLKPKSFVSE